MKEKFDIIVLGGQSNAEGFGLGPVTEEYIPDERILWMNDNANPHFENDENGNGHLTIDKEAEISITIADEPFNEGKTSKIGKLAFFFAKEYVKNGRLQEDRKLLIINAAVGGTGFCRNEWGKSAILYERLKKMVEKALAMNAENRIVAFLWHQGECDSFENADWSVEKKYTTHKKNLGELFDDFKECFTCKKLSIIAAGFCDEWYLQNKVPCDAVLKAIQEVLAERNGAFVDTSGLKSNNQMNGDGDDIHFCRESAHILGKRYYEAYAKIEQNK